MRTEHIAATAQEAAGIEELLKAPYPVTLATVASQLKTSELTAAQKLPEEKIAFVNRKQEDWFDEVWEALAAWEKVTLFIVHDQHVFEVAGKLHKGKRAQGYYNILAKDAQIGGHLRFDRITDAAFVNFPFMGRESLSVAFFNTAGAVSFSVYVGRENHRLVESVRETFFADRDRFCK